MAADPVHPTQPIPLHTSSDTFRYCFDAEGRPIRNCNRSRRSSLAPDRVPIDVVHSGLHVLNDGVCLSVPSINPPAVDPVVDDDATPWIHTPAHSPALKLDLCSRELIIVLSHSTFLCF